MKNIEYIIVQAGGKGTRLEYLTKNKPKALVPVNNLPIIFHLFNKFPNKKFIIIGDYKKDVLKKYLDVFSTVNYLTVDATGTGTCGGIKEALNIIPEKKSFMLIWSDLILADDLDIPSNENNYVGLSKDFTCRWSFINDSFVEEKSSDNGVAGLFVFQDKNLIFDVPESGEFVAWLKNKNIKFKSFGLYGTREFGTLEEYNKLPIIKCRPFNKMSIINDKIVKEPIGKQGEDLSVIENSWYEFISKFKFESIPKIYSFKPLTMELIKGGNIYECENYSFEDKKNLLKDIVDLLKKLHSLDFIETNYYDIYETYIKKTFDRLNKIRDLVPHANEKYIMINGKKCKNIFFYKDEFIEKMKKIKCNNFCLIHGDCTFSNIMIRDSKPILIDPRGYFGKTKMYGDAKYDWAKLYYSIVGDYDKFNLKKFRLNINDNGVILDIDTNNWKDLKNYFFELIDEDECDIKLLHTAIWLSLTTYAWQDYDSICAAFYNGLLYLTEVL